MVELAQRGAYVGLEFRLGNARFLEIQLIEKLVLKMILSMSKGGISARGENGTEREPTALTTVGWLLALLQAVGALSRGRPQ